MTLRAFSRNLARATARFRNASAGEIAAMYWRAARLQFTASTPSRHIPQPSIRPERVVISLTTIPARARHIRPALLSLLDQDEPADRILLNYPVTSLRTGAPYPDPATLDLPAGIDVLRCTDSGPSTKLLPAIGAEPGALIIVADDDVIYPSDFVATLLAAHRSEPAPAWGYRGVALNRQAPFAELSHIFASALDEPQVADILFGTWGYAVTADMFDEGVFNYPGVDDAVRWVDDVWISGHLARRGVPRKIVASRLFPVESLTVMRQALTSGINRSGENDEIAIAAFGDDWSRPNKAT